MSDLNLNLLPSQAKFQASKIKLTKKVRSVMVFLAVVWLAIGGVILGLNLFMKVRLNDQQKKLAKSQNAYLAMEESIVISQRLKYKAKMVGSVLGSRFEYGKAFEAVKNLFPEEVSLVNFNLKSNSGFVIAAKTQGQKNMDKIESVITDINQDRNENFKTAKLTSLVYKQGEWSLTMEVQLK